MKSICLVLIATLMTGQTAAAFSLPALPADAPQEYSAEHSKSRRLLKPLLTKIVESGAFDGEEGKELFLRAVKKALKANRKIALKNLDRLNDERLREQIRKSADRAEKDGAKPLASWLASAAQLEGTELREKLRELHSPERAEAFYEKIRLHVENAGSVRKAVETMDDCWDLVPLLTEAVILLIWLSWEIAILHPLLFIIMLPALIAWIVALPFALIIDYVILLPFCFLMESIGECGEGQPALSS